MEKQEYLNSIKEITDWDNSVYWNLVEVSLTPRQKEIIRNPAIVFDREEVIIAVHWHPENVQIELIKERNDRMYPNKYKELIIPTQHNQLVSYGAYTGVETDCYSRVFNRKVQLLFHFENSRLEKADVFKSMLDHTYKYRASQFYEFLETLVNPSYNDRIQQAVAATEAEEELVEFVRNYAMKIKMLIDTHYSKTPKISIKNKLLPNYFTMLKKYYDRHFINRALLYLKEVKKIVKKNFVLDYFYETEEMIEEVRSLGGGIVVPHPEQFWPILLADYDVDGYEVWNPQSREFTDFLINVVIKKNKTRQYKSRPLLVTMGDDTHMGEKLKEPEDQDIEKASREIGYQPPWDDIEIAKSLILGNFNREKVIDEYISRIA